MIYFISGLGADQRVFQFLDLPKIEHRFIQWNEPKNEETLSSYCLELSRQIDATEEIILVGVSFGGIIAQEISKIISCKKVIIISSVKLYDEYSWQLKLVSKLQLHRIAPLWFLRLSNKLTASYYFSTEHKEEAGLLQQIIDDTDPKFLVWAINQIMNWKNITFPQNLIHIHGDSDRIFPTKRIKNAIILPKSGHFMIVNRAAEIEQLIFEHI